MQEIKIKIVVLSKIIFGSALTNFFSFIDKIIQIIKFTIPDERTSPTTPKLKGKKLPEFLIGAPISIQSQRKFSPIPNIDKWNGRLVISIE